jgi:hypothetical protein
MEPDIAKFKSRINRFLIDRMLSQGSRSREMVFDVVYPALKKMRKLLGSAVEGQLSIGAGNWHGNDTAWRMTADLARIILYADREGKIRETPQRRFFSIVDGIIAGESEGPLASTPKLCGVLLGGDNLLAVDLVGTRLMGFEWRKVKYLKWLVEESPQPLDIKFPADDIEIFSNIPKWCSLMHNPQISDLNFEPHSGWKGYIEIER